MEIMICTFIVQTAETGLGPGSSRAAGFPSRLQLQGTSSLLVFPSEVIAAPLSHPPSLLRMCPDK